MARGLDLTAWVTRLQVKRYTFSHPFWAHFRIRLPHKLISLQLVPRAAEASLERGEELGPLAGELGVSPRPRAPPASRTALPPLSGPARLPLRRAEWKSPHPRPVPAPGASAPTLAGPCHCARRRGGCLCRGARSPPSMRLRLGRALRNTVRRPGTSAARLPGPEAGGTRREAASGCAPPPTAGSGGWARLRQSVRSEMAEPPRRGPRPREQGSRAAPGRGGARGQRGRRPVRRVSRP